MKRYHLFEAAGMLTALFGALALVSALSPVLNPARHKLETGRSGEPLSYYLTSIPIAALILSVAWFFNRKARRLRRSERDGHEKKTA